ncbi:MAG: transposase [Burkholderiales bacterium]|nr:transposase [Burkholderiales bacterium]
MTCLITWACYGSHLHGDARGSYHHVRGALDPDPWLEAHERHEMTEPAYSLDAASRNHVRDAVEEVCRYRGWSLLAVHVRQEHVHVIADVDEPEAALRDFKAYSSRRLKQNGCQPDRVKRWSRSGNIVQLNDRAAIRSAVRYVIEEQGTPMATYLAEGF